ncbi:endonuclease 8-like 1 isoform X2 [Paroedura picta]|uniref:endonuclease 8-like 1 isoform X2 n=1 Tax=Paroedura picta TaxID=143630 RepID=UPI0040572428
MPEGPEISLASQYINGVCDGLVFSGRVEKSQVSKNSEVPFESEAYLISATSRGKELKLTLTPISRPPAPPSKGQEQNQKPMDLIVRFGMSGLFKMTPEAEIPKHAHLRFYTKESPRRTLCFVDFRRFGRWEADGSWQPNRGPCVMLEYEKFRENVLKNLSDKAFNKPICEALLDQKFFNGIGNYLRAEILYRSKIPPFEKARTVLESLQRREPDAAVTLSRKVKQENPDLLELCHVVPTEVVRLVGKGYNSEWSAYSSIFKEWLQCYSVPGMRSLQDANGRTIWFQGNPGPLTPKGRKSRKRQPQAKKDPEVLSPKVTKSRAGKDLKIGTPKAGADGRGETKKRGRLVRENAKVTAGNDVGKPTTRARRKALVTQDSPMAAPAVKSRNRRVSAPKDPASPAVASRAQRPRAKKAPC